MPPRLRIGIIGAGRKAVLGAALRVQARDIVVGRLDLSRPRRGTPGVPIRSAPDVARDADLVLLAVPDDVLPGLVTGLVETIDPRRTVHRPPSGRYGTAVLDPVRAVGAMPLAIHLVMTLHVVQRRRGQA